MVFQVRRQFGILADSHKGIGQKKTAFITKYRLFEHAKMGYGLCNAPATFARVIILVLSALAFLDDVLIMGENFQDHQTNLREALDRFRQYGLKLKPNKCAFFQKRVEFLGFVSENSIEMADMDIETAATAIVFKRRGKIPGHIVLPSGVY